MTSASFAVPCRIPSVTPRLAPRGLYGTGYAEYFLRHFAASLRELHRSTAAFSAGTHQPLHEVQHRYRGTRNYRTPERVRIISPAMISPAHDGTNETLPGTLRLPGAGASPSDVSGARAGSSDQRTRTPVMPRVLSSRRITRASGHTEVSSIGLMRNLVGSSLFPVPIELMIFTPAARQREIISSFDVTVSIASAT